MHLVTHLRVGTILIVAFLVPQYAMAEDVFFEQALWSLSVLSEPLDSGSREGAKCGYVILNDWHFPPAVYNSFAIEHLTGQSTRVTRLHSGFGWNTVYPHFKRYSVVFRLILGVEYVDDSRSSGWAGVYGGGLEFILRPSARTQVSLEFNRLDGNRSGVHNQYGLSYRLAFGSGRDK